MSEYKVPSQGDLRAFAVLISFLHQVLSRYQDINEEAEKFNRLLEQQRGVLEEHRSDLEDLTCALSDYEDECERVMSIKPTETQQNS